MYELRFICTLFNIDYSFFGRTYASRPVRLILTQNGYEAGLKDYLWYYTNFEAAATQLAIEFIVYEVMEGGSSVKNSITSLGWTVLPLVGDNSLKSLPLYEGTPRLLHLKDLPSMPQLPYNPSRSCEEGLPCSLPRH